MSSDALVLWTARVAALLALTAVACERRAAAYGRFRSRDDAAAACGPRPALVCWTAAFVLLAVHELLAFAFVHRWSHAAALRHTAERTRQLIGVDWGGGLYFNYAVTVLWGIDVVRRWLPAVQFGTAGNRHPAHSDRLHTLTIASVLFALINATAVFGHPAWWAVIAVWLVVTLLPHGTAGSGGGRSGGHGVR